MLFQGAGSSRAEVHNADPANGTFGGKVSGPAVVVDGDTLTVAGERVRLEGIDAPETAQSCTRSDGAPWPCGRDATRALANLIGGKDVDCDARGRDRYGRLLAICRAGGIDVNAAMVRSGYAWAFVKYSTTYVAEEREARQKFAGIWQGAAEPAWEFRHSGWRVAETRAPAGCAIKGNVTRHGHVYHMPWSPWYDRVTIDANRGERWFCSEADALSAGWRPAQAD